MWSACPGRPAGTPHGAGNPVELRSGRSPGWAVTSGGYARRAGAAPGGASPGAAGEEDGPVKKLVILGIVAAAAGFLVWKKMQEDQAEQDLWTEATNEYADLR